MKHVLDTNVLIKDENVLDLYDNVIIPIVVLEELDGLKKAEGELGFQARRAIKNIYKSKVEFDLRYHPVTMGWNNNKPDNIIVMSAFYNNATLVSNDINVIIKAESLGVETIVHSNRTEIYTGYKELKGDTDFISDLFNSVARGENNYNFIENEYLILTDTSLNKTYEFRYSNNKLMMLHLPTGKIKGVNSLQRCAIDLMNNRNIPIKIILGGYGSGKTYLSVKVALNHIKHHGYYNKILCIREPIGEGREIGFLKGSKEDKTQDFFKPIEQSLDGGSFELQDMITKGELEKEVPYFIKGCTFNDTIVLVDEAEDIHYKQLKLIGTRLGKNSCVYLIGDYKQSVYDVSQNNGLLKLADKLKGDPMVGIITLSEDVRSEASKLFARLD